MVVGDTRSHPSEQSDKRGSEETVKLVPSWTGVGHMESILVLDPGYGYGLTRSSALPEVIFEIPKEMQKMAQEDKR
jgi:hypothetical protein